MNYIVKIESEKHFEEVKDLLIELNQPIEEYPEFCYLDYDFHIYFHNYNKEWCVCGNASITNEDTEINIDQLRTVLTQQK